MGGPAPVIAFDTTPLRLGGGGVATYTRELLSAFATRDDLEVFEIHHARTGHVSTAARIAAGIDREARFYPHGLAAEARRRGADLIHVPAAMPARSRGMPLILTIHDAIPWRHPEWFTRANALQQRLLVGRAARHADRVITDSEASKRDIIEFLGVDERRVDVIHLGISSAFSPAYRDRAWLEERFGITGPVVLSVGTPEPRKNLIGAVEAFDRVVGRVPEATLVLVGGNGWGADAVSDRIRRSRGRIVRTGRLDFDDLTRILASADCFLFPSLLEGFGLPPLEAMASGVPVVSSDRPSLPEVLSDAAITADPLDAEGLADAVVATLEDAAMAADLRERGLARSARFTWTKTAELTAAAYRRAIA